MKKNLTILFFLISTVVIAQMKWNAKSYHETANGTYSVLFENQEDMPISAKFIFTLENLSSTYENEQIVVIPPKTKDFLIAKLKPINPKIANKFNYTSSYNFGNSLQEEFDEDYIYNLPFEKGKKHLVFQGYNGKKSHQNTYALDLNLKVGEQILAAREGIVVEVVNEHDKSCPDVSCAKFNNKIIIMHSDGTFADYAHLKYLGTVVKKGDIVEKNQLIGYSGNTGYSTGPHLHFSVFINRIDGKRTYIKTKFRTSENEGVYLEEGKTYKKDY